MTAPPASAQVSPSVALPAPSGGPSPPAGPGPAEERPLRSPSTGLAVQADLATPAPPDIAPLAERLAPTMPGRRAPRDARRAHASAAALWVGYSILRGFGASPLQAPVSVRRGRLPPHVAVRDVSRFCRHDGAVPKRPMSEVERVERRLHRVMAVRPRDHAACAVALEDAVTLTRTIPAGAMTFSLDQLLAELAETYAAMGRFDEALDAIREAVDAGLGGQPDARCRIAEILMRAGRVSEAEPIWAQVRRDTPDDVWLYNNAGIEYADVGDPATALGWLTDGLRLALATGDPERLVAQLAGWRGESLTALGLAPDDLQTEADQFQGAREQRDRQQRELRATAQSADDVVVPGPMPLTVAMVVVSRQRVRAGTGAVAGVDRTGRPRRGWPRSSGVLPGVAGQAERRRRGGHDRHPDRSHSGRRSAGLVCGAGQGCGRRTGRLRGSPRPYRPGIPHLVAAGT